MQKIMDEDRFLSPSFNSCYSSDALAGITDNTSDDYGFPPPPPPVGSAANRFGIETEADGKTQAKKKKKKSAAAAPPMAAHEAFYLRSKAAKEGEKRKSYLPYRRELVGFFANVKPAAFGKI
ncbi:hypothetical protein DM860_008608 [Cuscuta australis]|uniref:Uncharacterized protein n=1 Tax=Cuscuta australis TaxID=267555 RepID=A0A328D700_9ASTE|nr:hypothetical protein DM860_008608 [Cuscuta australis]